MSDIPLESPQVDTRKKSMWPAAAIILLVVFTPALIAWGMGLLFN